MTQSVDDLNLTSAPDLLNAATEDRQKGVPDEIGRQVQARYGPWSGVIAHQVTHGLVHRLMRWPTGSDSSPFWGRSHDSYPMTTLIFRRRNPHAESAIATGSVQTQSLLEGSQPRLFPSSQLLQQKTVPTVLARSPHDVTAHSHASPVQPALQNPLAASHPGPTTLTRPMASIEQATVIQRRLDLPKATGIALEPKQQMLGTHADVRGRGQPQQPQSDLPNSARLPIVVTVPSASRLSRRASWAYERLQPRSNPVGIAAAIVHRHQNSSVHTPLSLEMSRPTARLISPENPVLRSARFVSKRQIIQSAQPSSDGFATNESPTRSAISKDTMVVQPQYERSIDPQSTAGGAFRSVVFASVPPAAQQPTGDTPTALPLPTGIARSVASTPAAASAQLALALDQRSTAINTIAATTVQRVAKRSASITTPLEHNDARQVKALHPAQRTMAPASAIAGTAQWGALLVRRHLETSGAHPARYDQGRAAQSGEQRISNQPVIRRQTRIPLAATDGQLTHVAEPSLHRLIEPAGPVMPSDPMIGAVVATEKRVQRAMIRTLDAGQYGQAAQPTTLHSRALPFRSVVLRRAAASQATGDTSSTSEVGALPNPVGSFLGQRVESAGALGASIHSRHLAGASVNSVQSPITNVLIGEGNSRVSGIERTPLAAIQRISAGSERVVGEQMIRLREGTTASNSASRSTAIAPATEKVNLADPKTRPLHVSRLGASLYARFIEDPTVRIFRSLLQPPVVQSSLPIVVAAKAIDPPTVADKYPFRLEQTNLKRMAPHAQSELRTQPTVIAEKAWRAPSANQAILQRNVEPTLPHWAASTGELVLSGGSSLNAHLWNETEPEQPTSASVLSAQRPFVNPGRHGLAQRTIDGQTARLSSFNAAIPAPLKVQRGDANGVPPSTSYPSATGSTSAELGGALFQQTGMDDMQLERMANKVYHIIEQRLILERESKGMF